MLGTMGILRIERLTCITRVIVVLLKPVSSGPIRKMDVFEVLRD